MSLKPHEGNGHSPPHDSTQLRRRMIRDTEVFLNERLNNRNGGSSVNADKDKLNPRGNHDDRRQLEPRAHERINIRTRPHWGTIVEIRTNQRGGVDNKDLKSLESQLVELVDDRAAGDIVIGLQRLEVMTAGFMSLLASITPRLACQQRRLTLCNLQPQCADLLEGSGLEQLVCCTLRGSNPDAA